MFNKTLKSLAFASAIVILAAGGANASDLNIKSTAVGGLRLGMTPQQVLAVLRPKAKVSPMVGKVVCEKAYQEALRRRASSAIPKCITVIIASSKTEYYSVHFVEDLIGGHPGTTIATRIVYEDNRVKSEADADAFASFAQQKFGAPDMGSSKNFLVYCNSTSASSRCIPGFDKQEIATISRYVGLNTTPYGYDNSSEAPIPEYSLGAESFTHHGGIGRIVLEDNITPYKTAKRFQEVVNPRTSTNPSF